MKSLCRVMLACQLLLLAAQANAGARAYLKKPAAWFNSADGKRIASNILSHQSPQGSWPKNTETTAAPYTGASNKIRGTFDNGATTDELRFLARAYDASGDASHEQAFLKGLDHILQAQYPAGGWPQYYPPPATSYHRYITFNDGTMVRLMRFLREVAGEQTYDFVDAPRRRAAQTAFDRGIDCILQCQIKVKGKLTAWCAQHDEKSFEARPARSYKLASLSGCESVGIVNLLMTLDQPSPEVKRAVVAAVAWFETARLSGIKVEQQPAPGSPKGHDRVVVNDPDARPMWARFYEIETNEPIFSGRDGVRKSRLADIEYERRNGYSWLGYWPEDLTAFPAWQKKWIQ